MKGGKRLSSARHSTRRDHMQRSRMAGGCFLMGTILLGFVVGLATGNAMRGVLIGTAIGIALAILVWMADRLRP